MVTGVALGVAALSALILAVASRSVAAAIGLHDVSRNSLTVAVPPAAADRIYGSPLARGRPIVVIDAGHGGRDPGATAVSGNVTEKQLTLALAQAFHLGNARGVSHVLSPRRIVSNPAALGSPALRRGWPRS